MRVAVHAALLGSDAGAEREALVKEERLLMKIQAPLAPRAEAHLSAHVHVLIPADHTERIEPSFVCWNPIDDVRVPSAPSTSRKVWTRLISPLTFTSFALRRAKAAGRGDHHPDRPALHR